MDNTMSLEYTLFLTERMIEDARTDAYIKECLAIAEGGNDLVERIESIHEGVLDKAKVAWEKLKTWIKNLWDKFMEGINKLARSDAEYLKKYNDIIFNRKKVDATYSMLDYPTGIERCTDIKVPKLNYATMKDRLDSENPGKFLKTIITDYNEKVDYKDFINSYFVGGSREPREIDVKDLKFADMYDLCVNYDKLIKILEADKKTIEASFEEAKNAINAIKVAPKPEPNNQSDSAEEDGQQQTVHAGSAIERFYGPNVPKAIYSYVMEDYIVMSEDGERTVKDTGAGTTTNTGSADSTLVSGMKNNNPKDERTPEQRTTATQNAVGDGEQERKDAIAKINVYNDVTCSIMSAKINAVQNAKKTYMKILRTHIKDHVGNPDSEKGSNHARTTYDKSSPEKQQEVKEYLKQFGNLDVEELNNAENAKDLLNRINALPENQRPGFIRLVKDFFIQNPVAAKAVQMYEENNR